MTIEIEEILDAGTKGDITASTVRMGRATRSWRFSAAAGNLVNLLWTEKLEVATTLMLYKLFWCCFFFFGFLAILIP